MNAKLGAIAALLAGALLAGGCTGGDDHGHGKDAVAKKDEHKDENPNLVRVSDEELARAGIRTEALAEESLADAIVATATVEPNRERLAHVTPRLPGRIVSVGARLGDRVAQGRVLATLESMEAGEAQAAYAQAAAEAAVAASAFQRAERLQAEQIIPAKEHQRARGDHEKARAQLQAAADKLRMLGMSPAAGSGAPARATFPVPSPLAGVVIERKAVLGELAKPDEPLFTVADLSTVWVEADIAEAQLARVREGAEARARVAAFPEETFPGKVNHLGAVLNKETRTVKAIIQLDNARGLLRPQMFATVSIRTGGERKVLAVAESAVTLVRGQPTVFIEEAAGFEARPVELGERFNGRVVVKSGIKPGELVAHEGVYALKARLLKGELGDGHGH